MKLLKNPKFHINQRVKVKETIFDDTGWSVINKDDIVYVVDIQRQINLSNRTIYLLYIVLTEKDYRTKCGDETYLVLKEDEIEVIW